MRASIPSPFACLGRWALLVASALLASACGGGGAAGVLPPLASTSTLVITSANQKAVAADALDSATDMNLAEFGSNLVFAGAEATATSAAAIPVGLASVALQLAGMVPPAASAAVGVDFKEPIACTSGSGSVHGVIANPGSLTAGDVMEFSTSNCVVNVDGVDATANGSISVTVRSGSLDTKHVVFPVHVVFSIVASNFNVAFLGGGQLTSGDQQVELTRTGTSQATEVLSGNSITTTVTTPTGAHVSTLRNYVQRVTENGAVGTLEAAAAVDTENTLLGKVSYQLSMPTPMTFQDGAIASGAMLIEGRNSALLVTGTGSNNLNLQLDANGDRAYEAATTTTGDELMLIEAGSAGARTM
jgi:hypothetical protein